MDVTKIRLEGLYTVDLPISVAQPSDNFIIKDASGLGPTGADVLISGRVYQGRQPLARELVIQIGLNPLYKNNETAAGLREKLYGMLTPATEDDSVPIRFMNGNAVVAQTVGRVSKVETVVFTKEPVVQLTLECVDAYLEAPAQVSLIPGAKDLFTVTNTGTAPTGIEVQVTFTAALNHWTLTFGSRTMRFDYAFQSGDILTFNTNSGKRDITVTRAGVTTNIISALSADSDWFTLHGGANTFTSDATTYTWNYLRYTPLYLGV